VRLPLGGGHYLGRRGALGAFYQCDYVGLLAATLGGGFAGRLLRFAFFANLVFLAGLCRPSLAKRQVPASWFSPYRLRSCSWCFS
jgi:hypothetical protein